MSIFATADLHGYPLSDFLKLLKKCDFSNDDYLFVLGDVIDRNGDGGIELLCWMMRQPNVELILGNHEKMMLDSAFLFETVTDESVKSLKTNNIESMYLWLSNGGDVTYHSLKEMIHRSSETVKDILSYCKEAPLYDFVSAGNKDFLLVHSGLGNFSKDKKLSSYEPDELLWTRPKLQDQYFDDVMTIIGHTPTQNYGMKYIGKAIITRTWINIDTGAAYEGNPMILRLDDLKEFYL